MSRTAGARALLSMTLAVTAVCANSVSATTDVDGSSRLAGHTTIVAGPGATQMPLVVERDITMPGETCYAPEGIEISGSAAGVLAVLAPSPYIPGTGAQVIGRFPGSKTVFDTFCVGRLLKAGSYTLTVLHTEGTAQIDIALPGLTGTSVLAPQTPSQAQIASVDLDSFEAAREVVAAGGERLTLTGRGSTIVATSVLSGPGTAVTQASTCEYGSEGAALPDSVAYLPPCAAGSGAVSKPGGAGEKTIVSVASGMKPGSYGLGYNYVGSGDPRPGGTLVAVVPD